MFREGAVSVRKEEEEVWVSLSDSQAVFAVGVREDRLQTHPDL